MEITNTVRQRVWNQQPKGFLREANAFVGKSHSAFAPPESQRNRAVGVDKGLMRRWWSRSPNTNEVLYLVNRPGNVVSHEGCAPWIDRAIKLVAPHAREITLRGIATLP